MAAGVCKQLGEKYLDLARSSIHYASNNAIKSQLHACIVKANSSNLFPLLRYLLEGTWLPDLLKECEKLVK